jgi:outer membrane lipoprotein-sorting protein
MMPNGMSVATWPTQPNRSGRHPNERMRYALLTLSLCLPLDLLSAEPLADVLARVDQAAAQFKGMRAKLKRVSYTAVIKDTSEESGTLAIRAGKPGEMQVRVDLTSPDEKTWVFRGRKAELYIPKINTVQEYDLGKQGRLVDQFLLLGFGSRSQELSRNYTLSLGGEDTVSGQKATRIELVPKSKEAREHLTKVEIWFPHTSGSPLQQKFYLTSGDYMLVSYADLRLEPNLPDTAVKLNLPKNVKREYPQK